MKVGVVGLGRQGQRRASALQPLVEQPLVLHDINGIAKPPSYHHRHFAEFSDLLKEVDAVAICTPSSTHYAFASIALEAGKHVLVEKPMTLFSDQAEELVGLAKAKGLGLHVGLNMRYREPAMAVFRAIANFEIGNIKLVSGSIGHSQFSEDVNDPRRSTGGGPLLDSGTHLLDLALKASGTRLSLDVMYRRVVRGEWSESIVLLTSGVSINITASYSDVRKGVGHRMLFIGDRGSITLKMGDPDDSVTIANSQGVKTETFQFPDKCWELDCKWFLETCRCPDISNAREAARLVALLT